ncbi:MAG: hypothetical protein NVS9B4_00700 [Candidatus Acidiferrum sp.]
MPGIVTVGSDVVITLEHTARYNGVYGRVVKQLEKGFLVELQRSVALTRFETPVYFAFHELTAV